MVSCRVFTFAPDWGLPTTGPFALKLLAWMRANGIAYEQVIENNPAKGPLKKSPWIEIDGERIADSDAIIRELSRRMGKPDPEPLDTCDNAAAHAFKTAFEERFHQILEWELFVHPNGFAYIDGLVRSEAPPLAGPLIARAMRHHFVRQLHARGIARHAPEQIAELGRIELDGVSRVLSERTFLGGERPVLADFSVFGQVAPMIHWPMDTPVAGYARTVEPLVRWADRMNTHCFGNSDISDDRAATVRVKIA